MKIAKFITINVGLHVNDSKDPVYTPAQAISVLRNFGIVCIYSRHDRAILKDRTEETLVVMIPYVGEMARLENALYYAADALAQDCIAMAYEERGELVGELIGPRASLWGEFDPQYFLPYDDAIDMTAAA